MLGPVSHSPPSPRRPLRIAALLVALGLACGLTSTKSSIAFATESEALESLEALARDPIWLALVHQARRPLDRGARAALHASGFFFHPDGGQRPDLELEATLLAFQQPDATAAAESRCRFPARHRFLAEHGRVPTERGPCPELDEWRALIGEVELTLIFPEAFLGNPASMFGHTLLRFDPEGSRAAGTNEPLLSWALDYSADPEGDVGPIYLLRGLVGGYYGRFSIAPYYEKTKVYGDWQDRDIWEYPLHMSAEGRERLVLHVWEMRDVALPYYFFTQNCSEKLLEMLEVGWPELGRGGGFPPAVTPVDTLRAMAAVGDSVGRPTLRASPATELQVAMASLSREDADRVEALAAGRMEVADPDLASLEAARRARILEVAYDLLRHRFLAGRTTDADSRSRSRALLIARSQIGAVELDESIAETSDGESEVVEIEISRVPPDLGHGTARVGLAGGIMDRDAFLELHLLPAYHTILDAPGGFAEGGEIKALATTVRYFPELDRVRLHELVVIDVSTASPWRRPFRPMGWHFDLGLRTRLFSSDRDRGLDTEALFRTQGGVGMAIAPLPGLQVYGFGEIAIEASSGIEGDFSLGPLLRSGIAYATPKGRYSVHLEGIAGLLTGPQTSPWLALRLDHRISLARDWSLEVGGGYERAYDVGYFEGRLGITRYF